MTTPTPQIKPPANMLAMQVVNRQNVARDAVSLFLAVPRTLRPPAGYVPGQFVTLAIPTPTETLYRSYSLCGAGLSSEPWEITVKRVHRGRISNYLCDSVPVGSILYVSMPRGVFTLPQPLRRDVPIIFVAAGSGITPIRGMLRALSLMPPTHRPQVQLHYAAASPEEIIYRDELAAMDPQRAWLHQWVYLSSQGQKLTPDVVASYAGPILRRAHWYICGPDALRSDMGAMLAHKGVHPAQVHVEVFATQRQAPGGLFSLAMPGHGPAVQMTIQETQAALDVRGGETVLAALERHGYQPDFSCRSGTCGACKLRLLAGRVEQSGAVALTPAEKSAGFILSCVAHPRSDITLLSGGRPPSRRFLVLPRAVPRTLVRAGSTLAVAALLLGTWQLTNHRPAGSAAGVTAAPPATATPVSGAGSPPTAIPTDTPFPTETPTPVFGGNPGPTATDTPAPVATDTPAPSPTDTPTPVATDTPVPLPPTPTVVTGTSGHIAHR